jgi:hypothetical protein
LIYAVIATPILVVAVLERHNMWLLGFGVFLGMLLGAYVALLESPPGYIENWRTGFEGERRTARVLAPLRRDGYVLLHNLPDRRSSEKEYKGDIDHVVVCPGGVFLLNSKWLGGEVSIRGERVHVQRRDDDDDSYQKPRLASGMRGCAVRLQEDIAEQTDVRFVQAVVVFWDKFDSGLVMRNNVVFVHGDRLVDWLREQRTRLTADNVVYIAACIRAARPPEHRGWRNRLSTLGLRGRRTLVAPVTGGATGDS